MPIEILIPPPVFLSHSNISLASSGFLFSSSPLPVSVCVSLYAFKLNSLPPSSPSLSLSLFPSFPLPPSHSLSPSHPLSLPFSLSPSPSLPLSLSLSTSLSLSLFLSSSSGSGGVSRSSPWLQLLTEMDGVEQLRDVTVLAATQLGQT